MTAFFDDLETRSADERTDSQVRALRALISRAAELPGYADSLSGADPEDINSLSDLTALPVLRKSELGKAQAAHPPFGGFSGGAFDYVFQSPGPLYEPGRLAHDWWRFGRFIHAAGIGRGDIVQNCFAYHLTPAGAMFESGARAVGAAVLPAGTGQTDMQIAAAAQVGTTAYAGTPDYLKVLLDRADEQGISLSFSRAAVGGGALFPAMRQEYADRGISCLQCYGTADLGNIAYESPAMEGMIADEGVIIEIVTPGTGNPVPEGQVGEVVVTALNPDYPLIRFATGDLSAVMPGISPCGRTNMRIRGWMGRADQTTKIKGMFVRPEQVAQLVASHADIRRARVIADRTESTDTMEVLIESAQSASDYSDRVQALLKLRGKVRVVEPGSLPNDGLVIEDRRSYD